MAVSTSKKRKRPDGREYEIHPPIPCTLKDLDAILDKWIVDGIFKPNHVSREPIEDK